MNEALLTVEDVARLLHVSETTVRAEINEGKIEVVMVGRSVRIKRSELDRYVSANMQRRNVLS